MHKQTHHVATAKGVELGSTVHRLLASVDRAIKREKRNQIAQWKREQEWKWHKAIV